MIKKHLNVFMGQGLGNQLFIYSFILNLFSKSDHGKLKIAIYLNKFPKNDRDFKLNRLIFINSKNISINFNKSLYYYIRILPAKIFRSKKILRVFRIYFQKNIFDFERKMFEFPNHAFVFGAFINTKYVDPILHLLRDEIKTLLNDQQINKLLDLVDKDSVVVIHIRRGDTLGKNSKVRGILTEKYYAESLSLIKNIRNNKINKVIAITDDLDNSKKDLINIEIDEWYGPEKINVLEALSIFTKAKNFIGANSTLSWWGIKLAEANMDKVYILPDHWLGFKKSVADEALHIQHAYYVRAR